MEEEQVQSRSASSPRACKAASEILARWEEERERSPLDRVVAAEFRSRHYLNSRERRWVSEAVYGTVRLLVRQRSLLSALHLPQTTENLVRLWVSEASLASDRALSDALGEETLDLQAVAAAQAALPDRAHPQEYMRITLSYPESIAGALETQLKTDAIAAAIALNAQAPTTLRINPLRASRNQVLEALPGAIPTLFSPWGVILPQRVNINDLPGYRAGWFEVQEEASQLMALLTDALPEQLVVDVGAGAGGKTLALAALMQNSGRLMALDTALPRLEALRRRAERAGARCIEMACPTVDDHGQWQSSGDAGRAINEWTGKADCVLLDAPCTGSGVLRRSPDAKWRVVDLPAVVQLQQSLLQQSGELVALGGTLIYVTCAFERSQNEAVVGAFLETAEGRRFRVEPALPRLLNAVGRAEALAEHALTRSRRKELRERSSEEAIPKERREQIARQFAELRAGSYLRTWPHRQGIDAFFAACLRRVS